MKDLKSNASRYLQDILEQPRALQDVLAHLAGDGLDALDGAARLMRSMPRVVFSGMGSAYLSALPAARVAQQKHPNVHLIETSDLVRSSPFARETIFIVLSRSGESGEISEFSRLCRERGGHLVAITMSPDSTLARNAHFVIDVRATYDGLICVKAHTALMLAALSLVEDNPRATTTVLKPALADMATTFEGLLDSLAGWPEPDHAGAIYFLSHGYGMATAGLGALLVEEGVWRPAVAHTLDGFQHGPLEVVDETFLGVLIDLEPDAQSRARAARVREKAKNTLSIVGADHEKATGKWVTLPQSAVPPAYRPLLAAPSVQLLAYALAARKGHEAGQMRHLKWLVT